MPFIELGGITKQQVELAYMMHETSKYQIINGTVKTFHTSNHTEEFTEKYPHYKFFKGFEKAGLWEYQLLQELISAGAVLPNLEIIFNNYDEPRVIPFAEKEDIGFEIAIDKTPALMKNLSEILIKQKKNKSLKKDITEFYEEALHHSSVTIPAIADYTYKLLPVFGRSNVPYFFKDIRFPDAYHFRKKYWLWHTKNAKSWNNLYNWTMKENKIYWRGSTTGGRLEEKTYTQLHRWKWVKFANEQNTTFAKKTNVTFSYIKFCSIRQCLPCYTRTCNIIKNSGIPPLDPNVFSQHWKYKVLMDLEGYAWSNRFKLLLYSNSIVFRPTTIFREFWQDWVEPWKHYIPVKYDFSDVEEKLDRVINGDPRLLSVIQPSTSFVQNNLRIEDVYCYTYRLLLDYAKLLRYKVEPSDEKEVLWNN